jgi:CheY-like chemotaxis protein
MDCLMPVLDGYAATRAIRERERRGGSARQPICALTANALPADVERAREVGMDAHLAKPFTLAQLHATIAPWLAADRATRAATPA